MSALSVVLIGCGSCAGQGFLSLATPAGVKVVQYTNGFDFLACKQAFSFDMFVLSDDDGAIGASNILDVIVRKNRHAIVFRLGGKECLDAAFMSEIYPSYMTLRVEDVVPYILSIGQKEGGDGGEWSLCRDPACLISPSGQRVALSGEDYSILDGFLNASGMIRSCDDIALRLKGQAFDVDAARVYQKVFRLRKKVVKQAKTSLPLLTIHGRGYIFHGRLISILKVHRNGGDEQ